MLALDTFVERPSSMRPFTEHMGIAIPIVRDNIDTDTIIPSREMKAVSKTGLTDGLFAPWRYTDATTRSLNTEFALNQDTYAGATILISGRNFGCGSSREHAVWALAEFGFRAIIAQSFGAIFKNNAVRNGILPIELRSPEIEALADWVSLSPTEHRLTISLIDQTVTAGPQGTSRFEMDPDAKTMLINGLDEIGLTEQILSDIEDFEARDSLARPWIYLKDR